MVRAKTKEASELEARVMQAVWELGSCTTDQIRGALASHKELADSTIRTLLHRLETKGHITHSTEGRTNVYTCRFAPGTAATGTIRSVIERFFEGSAENFLLGLVSERVLSKEDLAEAAAKLDAAAEKKPAMKGSKRK